MPIPCTITSFCLSAILMLTTSSASAGPAREFVLFDGLAYSGKPELTGYGLVPIVWVGNLWRPGRSKNDLDEAAIRSIFQGFKDPSGYFYLDIENWPLQDVSEAVRRRNIEKLTRTIDLARLIAPKARLGFYGILPGITYWPLMKHDGAYQQWLAINRELAPLAAHVDAVFPSLYTFYNDPEAWKSYARQTLLEARKYGKPVYAFLWPEFHDSNPLLRGSELPPAYWRAQLELCAQLADGVVLWGGWQRPWNGNAPWWQETLAFKRALENADHHAQ
jgi:hypothetical protein